MKKERHRKKGVWAVQMYRRNPKKYRKFIGEEKISEALPLYSGKTREEVGEIMFSELTKRICLALISGFLLFVLSFAAGKKRTEQISYLLQRPPAGETESLETVLLETEEGWKEETLKLGALEYTAEQIDEMQRKAEQILEQQVPGENADWIQIRENLYFPEALPDLPAKLVWRTDRPELVTSKGVVKNEELETAENVTITAKLYYGEEYRVFEKLITVFPKVYTEIEEQCRNGMKELSEKEKDGRSSEWFELPAEVFGMRLKLPEKPFPPVSLFMAAIAVLLVAAAYSSYFSGMDTKKKKRMTEAAGAYQEFVTRVSLLMTAGLSARHVWRRLAEEYEERYGVEGHVLAKELFVTERELENGRFEAEAYEAFGERMGLVSYQRLMALLAQYVTRGVQGMQRQMLEEAKEVVAQEREQIKVRGEEVGTKLLFPMMGFLVLVFALLLVPAFLSFS